MKFRLTLIFLEILFGIGIALIFGGLLQVRQNHHNAMALLNHYKELRRIYETAGSLNMPSAASQETLVQLKKAIEQRENPNLSGGVRLKLRIYLGWIGAGMIGIALYDILKRRYYNKPFLRKASE